MSVTQEVFIIGLSHLDLLPQKPTLMLLRSQVFSCLCHGLPFEGWW